MLKIYIGFYRASLRTIVLHKICLWENIPGAGVGGVNIYEAKL